jgi:hypothetical protein
MSITHRAMVTTKFNGLHSFMQLPNTDKLFMVYR